MVQIFYSTSSFRDRSQPTCEVEGYPEIGDYFTITLFATRCGLRKTLAASREIANGTRSEFIAPPSEAHEVTIAKPSVTIARLYHPDADDPDIPVEFHVPFQVFLDALDQWAQHVRDFERTQ